MADALRTTYCVPQIGSKFARLACGTKRSTRAAAPCDMAGAGRLPVAARLPALAKALRNDLRSMNSRAPNVAGRLLSRQSAECLSGLAAREGGSKPALHILARAMGVGASGMPSACPLLMQGVAHRGGMPGHATLRAQTLPTADPLARQAGASSATLPFLTMAAGYSNPSSASCFLSFGGMATMLPAAPRLRSAGASAGSR